MAKNRTTKTTVGIIVSINDTRAIIECPDGKIGIVSKEEMDRTGLKSSGVTIGDYIDVLFTGRMQKGKYELTLARLYSPSRANSSENGPVLKKAIRKRRKKKSAPEFMPRPYRKLMPRPYRKFDQGASHFTYAYAWPDGTSPRRSDSHVFAGSIAAEYINALVNATGLPWQHFYDLLIGAAKELGLMPEDNRCVEKMLAGAGFFLQPGKRQAVSTNDLIHSMDETCKDGRVAIFMVTRKEKSRSCISAVIPTEGNTSYALCDNWDKNWENIGKVWMRWPDGSDHGSAKKRSRGSVKKQELASSSTDENVSSDRQHGDYKYPSYMRYYQPNPRQNWIGDCSIRAISAACGISWEEALDKLSAAANGYPLINTSSIIRKCLLAAGFTEVDTIKEKDLRAIDFCDYLTKTYCNGERIFAFEPKHAAAFLPDSSGAYRIWDCWDSSLRVVESYYVKEESLFS